MFITDKILKRALSNVYFIWGRGKTTIANSLHEKYGYFIYSTDDAKDRHWEEADPAEQPYMCRDYIKEYGVKDFWALPKEVIGDRERHVQAEVTPMLVTDLLALAAMHKTVICEGDIDYGAVIPFASHMIFLHGRSDAFDWFNRPDHDSLDAVRNRTDISESEKEAIIQNAYAAVSGADNDLPDWVIRHNIPVVSWNDQTGIAHTTQEVKEQFGL
ncbi:MAG: hypothetical protein IJ480_01645 [Clostridia bacterium]|nr:hypothetical protein [Clostridia bacterium]